MDCGQARDRIIDDLRGRLPATESSALRAHLADCADCRAAAESERSLDHALEKLPQHAAPLALKRRLAASWPAAAPQPRRSRRWMWAPAAGAALAAAAALLLVVAAPRHDDLPSEAVNDHLRVLEGAPLAQVTGGIHEVKPWFAGKIDFAPMVLFAGDDEFPLAGGAVERFLDRKAAVFAYGRRLHRISLFVMRADGLPFPEAVRVESVRGFNVVTWREDSQGFVLVSDLNSGELLDLQRRIATARPATPG